MSDFTNRDPAFLARFATRVYQDIQRDPVNAFKTYPLMQSGWPYITLQQATDLETGKADEMYVRICLAPSPEHPPVITVPLKGDTRTETRANFDQRVEQMVDLLRGNYREQVCADEAYKANIAKLPQETRELIALCQAAL